MGEFISKLGLIFQSHLKAVDFVKLSVMFKEAYVRYRQLGSSDALDEKETGNSFSRQGEPGDFTSILRAK